MASHQTDLGLSLLHAHQGRLAQLLGSIVAIFFSFDIYDVMWEDSLPISYIPGHELHPVHASL